MRVARVRQGRGRVVGRRRRVGEQGVKWQLSGCVEQCMSLQCAQAACTCHRDGPSHRDRSVSRKTNQMVGEREGGPETMEPSRDLGQG